MGPEGEWAAPRDWFLAAIETDGSVDVCLDAVLRELDLRADFIRALQESMRPRSPSPRAAGARAMAQRPGLDALSDLATRTRNLENTLRFRLGILRPERPAAWFRAPAATSTGPFASALLDEPVFAAYEARDVAKIRKGLATCWQTQGIKAVPFSGEGACLWRTLLELNAELHELCRLAPPFQDLSLTKLPDGLPSALESRPLRAFLLNVRAETEATRTRLGACYDELLAASEKLWALQEQEAAQHAADERAHATRGDAQSQADHLREELRRRRQQQQQQQSQRGAGAKAREEARVFLSPRDLDALRVMGFEHLPNAEALRRRYLDLAKRLHPDCSGGSDHAFKSLSGAYAHLVGRLGTPARPAT